MHSPSVNSHKGKRGLKRILNAATYSWSGLQAAWQTEAAFRQVCALTVLGFVMLPVLHIEKSAWLLIIASHFFSVAIELLNSGIEAAVDHTSTADHPLAKRAKDMGSAAQAICLLNLAVVWLFSLLHGTY